MKEKINKPWYIRWWVYTIAFIVAFIIMPMLINLAFKFSSSNEFLVAEWNAGDALAFYGTILGAFVTVIALITTIVFTNKQNRQSELFQRNMIIADNKKVLLDEKYEKLFSWIRNIKEVVLLDVLKDENFWDKLFNKALKSFPEKLMECHSYLCAQDDLNNDIEKEFYKESLDIITSMISGFVDLSNKIEKTENAIKAYEEHKYQYERSVSKFENRLKQIQKQSLNQKTEDEIGFNEVEPKSVNDICQEFVDELSQKKEAYKDDYILLFNKYLEYKRNEQLEQVERLYIF